MTTARRAALLVSIVGAACGSSNAPPAPATPAATAPGALAVSTTFEGGAEHLRAAGANVDLAQLPVATWLGLPMSGSGSVDIDVRVPVVAGALDWRTAEGHVDLACGPCRLGDDHAKLRPRTHNARVAAFAGEGIDIGHVDLDAVHVVAQIGKGTAAITTWKVTSRDASLELALRLELAAALDDAKVSGCIRFRMGDGLPQRAPKTAAAIATTGAKLADDAMFHIRLMGTVGNLRSLAQDCTGTEPVAPDEVPPPEVTSEPPAIPPPPAAPGRDDVDVPALLASSVHRVDATTYTVDRALLDKALANPMAFAKGARVVPAVKDGKPNGFKLYAIRPGSLFAAIGLENGDTVLAMNGLDLSSADRALEAYTKLREATAIQMDVERTGKPLVLRYTIR